MLYLLVVAAIIVEAREVMSATTDTNLLPPGWEAICSPVPPAASDLNASFECRVNETAPVKWQLADLRTLLASFPAGSVKVSFKVTCENGGNISLPWPMRAPGLVEVRVRDCILLDKYDDFGTSAEKLGDFLRVMDLRNSTWLVELEDLGILSQLENLTSDYDCGQDSSIVEYIYRNIRDITMLNNTVLTTSSDTTADAGVEFKDLLQTIANVDLSCKYEKMEVYDQSENIAFPLHHFEFLVFRAKYPSLRSMNYSYIGLKAVPQQLKEWARYFPKLELIDLSHNRINDLTFEFPYAADVNMTLRLHYNNVSKISVDILKNWATMPKLFVDIRQNPIDCGCDLGNLLAQFKNETAWKGPAMNYYRSYVPDLTCFTPHGLKGRSIGSLSPEELYCPVSQADLRPAMAALVIVAVVLLVLLVLAVRYRREVRILVFTRAHVLLPCGLPLANVDVGLAGGKTYDAFVAYAHDDSDWVLRELCHRLENSVTRGRPACKLCIHQRDFVVGKTIIDNIIDSIAASRHTIVVVSPSFVKSSWAMEELQQALRQSLEERRRHLVIVMLKEVEQTNMPPVLKRCCKTFTYLEASDSLFWDRLQFSLHVTEKKRVKLDEKDANDYEDQQKTDDAITDGVFHNSDNKSVDDHLTKNLFLETMRTISVDSAISLGSAASDDRQLVTPPASSRFIVPTFSFNRH